MFFFLFISLLSFLSINTSIIGVPLLKWVNRSTSQERKLIEKRSELKQQQSNIPMVDNFAKFSKIQRKINSVDQELEEIQKQKSDKIFLTKILSSYGLKVIIGTALFFFSYYYRFSPILHLNEKYNLFPLSNIIAYPNEPNTVSVHFWIVCCTTAARAIQN
ncbi:tail-anchored protein insertion receptor WRB-like [Agrilus planipennis]|uniref:Guided entry of tail-anchored proteins factor 1 n=1 Tax=Agrilus planipennis TaxID=224129 RepID=A0A1W4XKB3_AGRPL|nr:tail-anchored protein insertion receptor WRB-like [Agrilus planipennis]